ncbi:protein stoned-A [Anopheles cruzii]|uniref:protein stoned-A n=1 Tax=Anopheles cruzii TaxID=68878 RepID=UPI0022EC7973|nr:protein stoned-A [Anopheles cruzii]
MLKLPKGLKKKKKGKKSKKDQELFTEEELEQYRREHQNQSALNSAAPSDSEDAPVAGENDEEWSKFTALTSGVDSVLKKTQGDLDRIKSTSFFQKVPTKLEQETKEREERERREQQHREQEAAAAKDDEHKRVAQELINAVVELSESEPNSEAEEDIFDTGYIDAIASGELPIAYIPESPVLESFEGPDPFDTSYAEKVIKGPEVSKRGKKLVSIGSAVQVLTGRVESVGTGSIKSRRQRRGPQNLLLESFDEGEQQQQNDDLVDGKEAPQAEEKPQNLTLLDDSADLPVDVSIDLSVSLHLSLRKQQQEAAAAEEQPSAATTDAEEFNLDEFDDLKLRQPVLAQGDDFELLTEKPEAPKKPSRPPPPNLPVADLQQFDEPEVDDPFDTGFVEKLLPATAVEDDEFDPRAEEEGAEPGDSEFDPRADESGKTADLFLAEDEGATLRVCQVPETLSKDLLSGSTSDLAGLGHTPLECVSSARPAVVTDGGPTVSSFDPFDTSAVDFIVAPGKTELKFLEEELLTADRGLSHSLSDPDFDPRADSEQAAAAVQEDARLEEDFQSLAQRKSSLSLHINGAAANRSKSVVFAVVTPDLLKIDGEHAIAKKPLTPYYNRESSVPDVEADPFDTSFVPPVEPTKLELTLLEQELTKPELRHSLSDPEFDPRACSDGSEPALASSDLLGVSEQHDQKVLTPARTDHGAVAISASTAAAAAAVEIDPFDTSIAVNLQPGRAELKLLEDELIPATARDEGLLSDFLSGGAQEASAVFVKVLTPQPSGGSIDLSGDQPEVDPFDTSFAENLGPGKTEIKLLEDELIDN